MKKRTGPDFLHCFHRDLLEYETSENVPQYSIISEQRVGISNAMMPLDSTYAKNLPRLKKEGGQILEREIWLKLTYKGMASSSGNSWNMYYWSAGEYSEEYH